MELRTLNPDIPYNTNFKPMISNFFYPIPQPQPGIQTSQLGEGLYVDIKEIKNMTSIKYQYFLGLKDY
jgi:hypothetical protein